MNKSRHCDAVVFQTDRAATVFELLGGEGTDT